MNNYSRDKSGFTLTELMGVIIILAVILTIVVPNVDGIIKQVKEVSYNDQINVISSAAHDWTLKNTSSLPLTEGNSTLIYLGELKKDGLVSVDLKDPKNGKLVSNLSTI